MSTWTCFETSTLAVSPTGTDEAGLPLVTPHRGRRRLRISAAATKTPSKVKHILRLTAKAEPMVLTPPALDKALACEGTTARTHFEGCSTPFRQPKSSTREATELQGTHLSERHYLNARHHLNARQVGHVDCWVRNLIISRPAPWRSRLRACASQETCAPRSEKHRHQQCGPWRHRLPA